jgi:calcineurin-like phosphoesterase family protein
MESVDIYKQLKKVYNTVSAWGQEVLMVASVDDGDILTRCVAITLPNIDEYTTHISSTSCNTENIEDQLHIEIRDVRDLINDVQDESSIFSKALSAEFKIINKQYREYVNHFILLDRSDPEYIEKFRQCIKNVSVQYLKDVLEPKVEQLDIQKYDNIYFTSDTHFGHYNILIYEQRTSKMNIQSVEEHDAKLIENWNNTVGKNDLVYILGDFSFHKADGTISILKALNGDKILIRGNHDNFISQKRFDKTLFKAIYDYTEINYGGQEICLMHYPIQSFKHMDRPVKPAVLLFGHIHSAPRIMPKHSYNVGVDVNNYKPIHINDAIGRALQNDRVATINSAIRGNC